MDCKPAVMLTNVNHQVPTYNHHTMNNPHHHNHNHNQNQQQQSQQHYITNQTQQTQIETKYSVVLKNNNSNLRTPVSTRSGTIIYNNHHSQQTSNNPASVLLLNTPPTPPNDNDIYISSMNSYNDCASTNNQLSPESPMPQQQQQQQHQRNHHQYQQHQHQNSPRSQNGGYLHSLAACSPLSHPDSMSSSMGSPLGSTPCSSVSSSPVSNHQAQHQSLNHIHHSEDRLTTINNHHQQQQQQHQWIMPQSNTHIQNQQQHLHHQHQPADQYNNQPQTIQYSQQQSVQTNNHNNSYYYDIDDEFSDIMSAPGSPEAASNHLQQQDHRPSQQMMINYAPNYTQQNDLTTATVNIQGNSSNYQQQPATNLDYAIHNQQQQQQQQQFDHSTTSVTYCDSYGSHYVMSPDSSAASVFSAASCGSGSPAIHQHQYQQQQQVHSAHQQQHQQMAVSDNNNTANAYAPDTNEPGPVSVVKQESQFAAANPQQFNQYESQLPRQKTIAKQSAAQKHQQVGISKQLQQPPPPHHHRSSPIHLWEFLKELLQQQSSQTQSSLQQASQQASQADDSVIRWLDKQKGVFKIEDSVLVAKLWGRRKNKPKMNYDKLSRSIRQYYKKGIMKKTDRSQRLVYQFCSAYCH